MTFYDAAKEKWGYLRETSELALKAGIDKILVCIVQVLMII